MSNSVSVGGLLPGLGVGWAGDVRPLIDTV